MGGRGKTASQIAAILGGVTRNAVIGKAHRLSLAARVSPLQQNNVKKRSVATPAAAAAKADTAAKGLVSMMDLTPRACCFPIGDPKKPGFGFCGKPSALGLPYCETHAKIAYQPAPRGRIRVTEDEAQGAARTASG